MHIFKVFTQLPGSRRDKGNSENVQNTSELKLIPNCPRALAITCLSHKGQNSVQRKTFKVLPSRTGLPVVIKEQASSRTGKAYYDSKQNTASSIHSKQFLYK